MVNDNLLIFSFIISVGGLFITLVLTLLTHRRQKAVKVKKYPNRPHRDIDYYANLAVILTVWICIMAVIWILGPLFIESVIRAVN